MKKEVKKQGFTLVEIMIVVMIIGLLATIGIPSFAKARENTLRKNAINNARIVISAAEQVAMEEGLVGTQAVASAKWIPYIKGGTAGLKVGAVDATILETITPDSATPEAIATNMYPTLVW